MEVTSTSPPTRLDRTDLALLAAFAVVAVLGTWQRSLMVIDGAVYLAAAWLGNAWDLFFDQVAGRTVSTLSQFGLAWALRAAVGLSSDAFMVAAHALYFAVPLALWLVLRALEPQRIFSRLYLAVVLVLIYFTSEMVAGMGLWMIWLALLADPARSRRMKVVATVLLAPALAFTHPAIALLSLMFALGGLVLSFVGRPFPRHLSIASAAMAAFLVAAYFVTAAALPASNPTIAAQHAGAKYDYIDPVWMLGTLVYFPALAALWLLLLAPGLDGAALRWRLPVPAMLVVGVIGLWFAFNGTNSLTWIFARQTAPYVLALALCLALASPPSVWLAAARRPLTIFATIIIAASVSYTIDLFLFGRAADARLAPLAADATTAPRFVEISRSAPPLGQIAARIAFKWAVGQDYVRDVVVPGYGGERMTFAFYTYFRSGRRLVLFRPLDQPGEWVPFECAPVDRALGDARDNIDRRMLLFIRERYCVPGSSKPSSSAVER
jgi:hypothetical protein